MEFNEIVNIWNKPQQPQSIKINQLMLKEISTNRIKAGLSEMKWTAIFQWVVGIFWIFFLTNFIAAHIGELKFFIPALILFSITIFGFFIDGYKLHLYYSIKPYNSIVSTQRKLEKLRLLDTIDSLSLLILIPLFAAPFAIVMVKYIANLDLYTGFEHLVSFTIGSFIVAVIITVLLILFPNKNLKASIEFLNELKESEK